MPSTYSLHISQSINFTKDMFLIYYFKIQNITIGMNLQ
ncbi:hypothetical protein LOK49_Contig125G00012 [Camellia lanceoleosa]|nr:hypothetical protein LOK49_Contig125G00012 [Camellia lanceoleosa]